MDDQLSKILGSISPSLEDTNGFGKNIIEIIKKSEALWNPENDYAYLKEFLRDEINFLEKEIVHTTKYAETVFHSNVSKSRKFEKETCEKILAELNK